MRPKQEIENYLLDKDGLTRDITFLPSDLSNIINLLSFSYKSFKLSEASDNDGNNILIKLQNSDYDLLKNKEGALFLTFVSDEDIFTTFKLFIDWSEDEKYGVEISFFPHHLNMKLFSMDYFVNYIDKLSDILDCLDYFVRCENASWEYYDSNGLGVIYTKKQLDR